MVRVPPESGFIHRLYFCLSAPKGDSLSQNQWCSVKQTRHNLIQFFKHISATRAHFGWNGIKIETRVLQLKVSEVGELLKSFWEKVPVVGNGDQIDLVLTWTRDKSGLCWQSWSLRNLREHVPGRFLIWVVTLKSWRSFHLPCWPSGRFLFSLLLFTTSVFISRSLQLGQSSAAEQQTGGVQRFTERFRTDLQRADGKVKAPRQTNKNRSLGSLMDKHGALTGRERGLRIQDFSVSHQGAAQAIRY